METVITQSKYYRAIANAIRDNKATEENFTPAQMADEVNNACTAQYERGFSEGLQAGKRVEQGVFTLERDSSSLTLNISPGAKMIEIIPQGTPAASTGNHIPVRYLFAAEIFRNNNISFPGKGAAVQYEGNGYHTTFYSYSTDDGFFISLDKILIFEAGMPYAWTAHFWQE